MSSVFADKLLAWYQIKGRKNLPWQVNKTPYTVWVSEIMLQQTQVTTVIPYFNKFLKRFPDLATLAGSSEDEVLIYWSGLGYYARARNLHKTATILQLTYQGRFPEVQHELEKLPGIGRSTAAAILSLAMHQFAVILDGNCKRVYARYDLIDGHYSKASVLKQLWKSAEEKTCKKNPQQFNQAIMDLGSLVCTRTKPDCQHCPVAENCKAYCSVQTDKYPHKKQTIQKPVKFAQFLLLKHKDNILLIKRPPTGIWASLWCLPQFSEDEFSGWEQQNKFEQLSVSDIKKHVFTHFILNYRVVSYRVDKTNLIEEAIDKLWINPHQDLQVALPAPIKKEIMKAR